jgi:hypothetical protein
VNKPIGFSNTHLQFLHKVSDAGVADHMLARWLAGAFPELGYAKAKTYRDYWVSITSGEKHQVKKHPKLK